MPMDDVLQEKFQEFVKPAESNRADIVDQCYRAMPWLSPEQQRSLLGLRAIAHKYGSVGLHDVLNRYEEHQRSNRRLGIMFTRVLQAVALERFTSEMMKPPGAVVQQVGGGRRQ